MIELLMIALSLALDAFSLAVSFGMTSLQCSMSSKVRISLSFGFFQFLMPLLGFWLGSSMAQFVNQWDHWIVFAILTMVGGKMIWDGFGKEENQETEDMSHGLPLLFASLATSIDAFAVGISFALLKKEIYFSSAVIGIVAFSLSFVGVTFGAHIGKNWIKRPELIGGLAIILIGIKTLLQGL
jgi:putative Mn2+ efflux pump MntP